MGAGNAFAAYRLWAGKVPPTSVQALVFMALVSFDGDDEPWFCQGYEVIAQHALGRPAPFGPADKRAVSRALGPLLEAKAIETKRHASVRREGASTAMYVLNLGPVDERRNPTSEESRETETVPREASTEDGMRPPSMPTEDGNRPSTPDDGGRNASPVIANGGRFVVSRGTVCDRTGDGNRPTEEEEEYVGVLPINTPARVKPTKAKAPKASKPTPDTDPAFDEFWNAYPLKVSKGQARKAWATAIKKAAPADLIAGACAYRDSPRRSPDYTAHPSTWLNNERWTDEQQAAPNPRANGNRPNGHQPYRDIRDELSPEEIDALYAGGF